MPIRILFLLLLSLGLMAAEDGETVVNADGMTLHLQGIGVAQELKSDLYIGAIYYPKSFTSLNEVTNDGVSKRLSFKLLSNLMPAKALQRHWKERIALNNPRNVWLAKGDSILQMATAFKDNLKYGDKIDFDYSPSAGTRIYFNNQLIETIETRQFFPLLMSAWFGDIPPTKSFKAALLAQNDKGDRELVLNQYNALNFTARTLASASKPEPKVEPEVVVASKAPVVAPAPTATAAKSNSSNGAANKKDTKPVKETNVVATVEPQKAPAQVAATVSTPAHVDTSTHTVAEHKPTLTESAPTPAPVETTINNASVDEDLLIGAYKREAMERIRGFLEYPPRAWRLGLTGSGVLRATLDRQGNLLSSEVLASTGQMILDQAMTKMLERSLPLPPPPKELTSNELSLEIAVDFVR